MALLKTGMTSSPGLPGVGGRAYPDDIAGCSAEWADAVAAAFAAVVPVSTAITAAAATLETALAAAFALPAAAAAMETAFTAFGATVGAGMAPAFTATPPAGAVGFAALFVPPYPDTRDDGIDAVATKIITWAKTGTATPSGGGSPVNWS
jgi:hypothetical protein